MSGEPSTMVKGSQDMDEVVTRKQFLKWIPFLPALVATPQSAQLPPLPTRDPNTLVGGSDWDRLVERVNELGRR